MDMVMDMAVEAVVLAVTTMDTMEDAEGAEESQVVHLAHLAHQVLSLSLILPVLILRKVIENEESGKGLL
jgi:hypothetical protein